MRVYEEKIFDNVDMFEDVLEECRFIDCEFENCTIIGTIVRHCRFTGCSFRKCRISDVKSEYSVVTDTEFYGCLIQGVNFSEWTKSTVVSLSIQCLSDCLIQYSMFAEMRLDKFDFKGCKLLETTFSGCSLRESDFYKVQMEKTMFVKCDLQSADFRYATGYSVDLHSVNLMKAKFSFPEVVELLKGLGIVLE